MYEYRGTVLSVVDGDTIHADIDLGCDIHTRLTLRLAGINAPEKATLEGKAASVWLDAHLPGEPNALLIRTVKDRREKYGRYLAELFVRGVSINEAMVLAGYAVPYTGGRR
jgi:micrococcal nuclease